MGSILKIGWSVIARIASHSLKHTPGDSSDIIFTIRLCANYSSSSLLVQGKLQDHELSESIHSFWGYFRLVKCNISKKISVLYYSLHVHLTLCVD